MSGTIRSRMEAQRDRHTHYDTSDRIPDQGLCDHCHHKWPCPDWVAADDTLTDLNNLRAKRSNLPIAFAVKLIDPDPDSRGAA